MKQKSQHPSKGTLRGLFCVGLSAIFMATLALNGAAANTTPVEYDVAVQSSSTHTAALADGDLYVWGANDDGQLPKSDRVYSPEPVKALEGVRDMAVSAGRTLVVTEDHVLREYGKEPSFGGPCGSSGKVVARDAVQVAAGDSFAAYINTTGDLYLWGQNSNGQLGVGDTDVRYDPVKVLEDVQKVSLGGDFALALTEDGAVYAWGANSLYEIGVEGNENATVLEPVKLKEGVKDIAVGEAHSCILTENGVLWTCGSNSYGQLGIGGNVPYAGLTEVMSGVRSISAGSYHNFAVTVDGGVYTWGSGISGQLGLGDAQRVSYPVEASADYVQVFAGYDNTFAVTDEGYVCSFGNNTNFRLGKSDGSDSLLPKRIFDKDMNWVYPEFADYDEPGKDDTQDDPNNNPSTNPGGDPVDDPNGGNETTAVTGFIKGYGDGSFKPTDNVTRAEFLSMLVSALREDYVKGTNGASSFKDIDDANGNPWYGDVVAFAQTNKLVNGNSDGTFQPNKPITRAEASIMTLKVMGLSTEGVADYGFTDLVEGSKANVAINALAANNILKGESDGRFRPTDTITRAESAVIVAKAAEIDLVNSENPKLTLERDSVAAAFPESPFTDVEPGSWYYAYVLRGVGKLDFNNFMYEIVPEE